MADGGSAGAGDEGRAAGQGGRAIRSAGPAARGRRPGRGCLANLIRTRGPGEGHLLVIARWSAWARAAPRCLFRSSGRTVQAWPFYGTDDVHMRIPRRRPANCGGCAEPGGRRASVVGLILHRFTVTAPGPSVADVSWGRAFTRAGSSGRQGPGFDLASFLTRRPAAVGPGRARWALAAILATFSQPVDPRPTASPGRPRGLRRGRPRVFGQFFNAPIAGALFGSRRSAAFRRPRLRADRHRLASRARSSGRLA